MRAPVRLAVPELNRGAALPALTWFAVAVGVLLRFRQWLAGRSFWLDEVMLANAVDHQSYGSLTRPLRGGQAAPIGWLWSEHTVVSLLGFGERTARLLPLLFGCGALVLVARLGRRLLSPAATALATGFVAVSPSLIYFSNEFKQYSSDVFWSLALVYAAVVVAQATPITWRHLVGWGGFAAVAVWFSHASILVAAGTITAGLIALLIRRRTKELLAAAAAGATLWGLSVLADYRLSLGGLSDSPVLRAFWRDGFAPQPLAVESTLGWAGGVARTAREDPFFLDHPLLVELLVLAGLIALARRTPLGAALVALPAVVALVAAIHGDYPFAGRLILFLVPFGLFLLAAAVDVGPRWAAALLAVPVVVLALPNVEGAVERFRDPPGRQEYRDVLAEIADRREPGDVVLTDPGGYAFRAFYGPRLGVPVGTMRFLRAGADCTPDTSITALAAAHGRVWVVFGHHLSFLPKDARDLHRAHFAAAGHHLERIDRTGVQADLYDLRAAPDDPDRASPLLQRRGAECLLVTEA